MKQLSKKHVLDMLDVTLLDMSAPAEQFDEFLTGVKELGSVALCVQPCRVAEAASFVRASGIEVASVVGYPHGGSVTDIKAAEAARAVADGATELDMVVNLQAVRRGDKQFVIDDIKAVVDAAAGHKVKVIVEAPLLSVAEKELVCAAIIDGGAAFIKTCTGVASNWADVEDVAMFRKLLPENIYIKASGKVNGLERLTELYNAGARRFGLLLSQAREILDQCSEGVKSAES